MGNGFGLGTMRQKKAVELSVSCLVCCDDGDHKLLTPLLGCWMEGWLGLSHWILQRMFYASRLLDSPNESLE